MAFILGLLVGMLAGVGAGVLFIMAFEAGRNNTKRR